MDNLLDQKILVYCGALSGAEIGHGIVLAKIFRKELCLFSTYRDLNEKEEVKSRLHQLSIGVIKDNPDVQCSWLFLKGKAEDLMDKLADDYNAILMVVARLYARQLMSALKNSGFPFVFVSGVSDHIPVYKKILMPVDFRKECKEAGLWASYFGRFNYSEVYFVEANEIGNYEENRLKLNLVFLFKLLRQFNIHYKTIKSKSGSWRIQSSALKIASVKKADLFIILGSRNDSFLDQLIGSPEIRILRKSGDLPVLCVNPRRDMYVMCEGMG
ncbi:MAG: universal stress protein [Bacteroidota bacterium]|nr:universal stress protein [Bacteroidota bacterium]MDP4205704.1 universal stress protein [Bacteroidota bacterium]